MAATVPWRRTFVIYWCGQFVALTGLALAMYSLGVYVYQLSGSATMLGVALALPILPFIAAAPLAGPLIDRWGPRRALLVANACGVLNLLSLEVFHATGTFATGRVMLFLWLAAGFKALHLAAFETSVPFLVPKRHLGRANGNRMFTTAAGAVVGPVVAGPLLQAIGFNGVVLMGCLSFGLGILSLRYVPVPWVRPQGARTAGAATLLREFGVVWRYAVARPGLLTLLAIFGMVNFGIGAAELLSTQLTLSFTSAAGLNTVLLAGAFGLATATVAMTIWGAPRRRGAGVLGFTLLFAAAMVLGSLRPSVPLLAVAGFLFLGSTPIIIGTIQTLWQTKTEPQLLGRMAALVNLFTDVPYSLANVLTGLAAGLVFVPLAGRDHVRSAAVAALVGAGPGRGFALLMMVIGVLIAVLVIAAYRRPVLRHLERDLPDVTPGDVAARAGHPVVEPTAAGS